MMQKAAAPPPYPSQDKRVYSKITMRVPRKLREQLRILAARRDSTMRDVIIELLEAAIADTQT